VGGLASAQSDDIKAMISHIPHPPSRVEIWSRRGPAATGHLREWRTIFWFALTLAVAGCGAATYREVRPSEPVGAAAGGLRVDVQRVFLTDDTIENGVADGMGLVVELTLTNGAARPYSLKPTALWCLMQVDPRKPTETRLLPPSVNGDGAFPGAPPEGADLSQIDVAPGQTRSFWVLFRGYQFAGSEIPRRITLTMPDTEGRALELALADPARGDLRWEVPPTRSAWFLGVRSGSLYGGYAQATSISTQISRLSRAGRFLWDVGYVSSVLVQVKGELRSSSSSFTGTGVDAHLTLPLSSWGDPKQPIRLGPYLGGQMQLLIAMQPTPNSANPQAPPVYGDGVLEAGFELDVGALRNAATPFPLSATGRNPLPRWLLRVGYAHDWIGHGTANGYVTSVRLSW
jgi:hypothetical protein